MPIWITSGSPTIHELEVVVTTAFIGTNHGVLRIRIPIRPISLQNYSLVGPQSAVSMQRKEISATRRNSVLVAPLAA